MSRSSKKGSINNGDINMSLGELHELLLDLQKEQKESSLKIDQLLKEVTAKDAKINLLETKVEMLEGKMAIYENTVHLLERKCDDNEQYSRRTSLRINNIPSSEDRETADKCVEKVVAIVNQIPGIKIKKTDIDRAHRVGKVSPLYPRQMIVKFKYWNTRSMIYKGRKGLKDNKIYLDLTKRLDLKN